MIGHPKPPKKVKKSKAVPIEVVTAVFERDKNICQRCKKLTAGITDNPYLPSAHCHHIIKKSQGGKNTADNLITICFECHFIEHN